MVNFKPTGQRGLISYGSFSILTVEARLAAKSTTNGTPKNQ
jgi:hypothetical protein